MADKNPIDYLGGPVGAVSNHGKARVGEVLKPEESPNKAELRRLAEAAKHVRTFTAFVDDFHAVANPTAVLLLLDEIEALQGLYRMHQQTETREMIDLKAERDQLRSGVEELRAKADCVDDCAYLIRKLVHCRRQLATDDGLAEKALDYLKRKGLQGSPMRGKETPDA